MLLASFAIGIAFENCQTQLRGYSGHTTDQSLTLWVAIGERLLT